MVSSGKLRYEVAVSTYRKLRYVLTASCGNEKSDLPQLLTATFDRNLPQVAVSTYRNLCLVAVSHFRNSFAKTKSVDASLSTPTES